MLLTWHVSHAMCPPMCPYDTLRLPCVIDDTYTLPCVTRHLIASKMRNFDHLRIQQNSPGQLEFTKRTQWGGPFCHPRSRKIPIFQLVQYRHITVLPFFRKIRFFFRFYILPPLKDFRPEIHTHIYTLSHAYAKSFYYQMTKQRTFILK